jgi:hypothetical protein
MEKHNLCVGFEVYICGLRIHFPVPWVNLQDSQTWLIFIVHAVHLMCNPAGCALHQHTAKPLTLQLKFGWETCNMGI